MSLQKSCIMNLQNKVESIDSQLKKESKESRVSSKPRKSDITRFECTDVELVSESDNNLDWLIEKINLAPTINEIYSDKASKPTEFIKEIARKMYGDLLSEYKFTVKRVYTDRRQRKDLNELDPVGVKMIKYILDLYYSRHRDKICPVDSNIPLSNAQFHDLASELIDAFGSQANCKQGRKLVHVKDTLFYKYVVEKEYNPTSSYANVRSEIREHLEGVMVPRETKKAERRRTKLDSIEM